MALVNDSFGAQLIEELRQEFPDSTLTHCENLAPRRSEYSDWPSWVHPQLRATIEDRGIDQLYSHQAQAAQAVYTGTDCIIATGTSSGKSLCYQLPILSVLADDPSACALYLTPTKALSSDQLLSVQKLIQDSSEAFESIFAAPYDGDTPAESRPGIREQSRFVFSNPDMLHISLLGSHPRWARLLRHLKFVVIDECHSYRGAFGTHIALVIRRLLRLCAHYGSHPTVVCTSATTADPAAHARRLTGRSMRAITHDGSPRGACTIALWEPGFIDGIEGENGAPVRRSATTEAAEIMAHLVAKGARTLTFVRSRRSAEITAMRCSQELQAQGKASFSSRIAAYRAGYLASDRRRLERSLDNGELLGVATTSALELGIDVGGLDAVVTAGFPGTVASFWQQAGRAGRRGQGSVVVLVGRDEPMDTYLIHHPEALLNKPVEASVFNPHNPHVLRGHVYCAAVEKPLSPQDIDYFQADSVVAELSEAGLLRSRPAGWFPAPRPAADLRPETAHSSVNVRGGSGNQVMIVDVSDGRLLGTIDSARAASQVHTGAVYIHQGESFVIEELDLDEYIALARPEQPDYTTSARSDTQIRILQTPPENRLRNYSPGLWVSLLEVEVVDRVTGYIVRLPDGSIAEHIPLDLPEQRLVTQAVAYTIDPQALSAMGLAEADYPGTLHAAEHAAIGLLPLLATCDRWDIGGVSTALHADTHLPTVFVYDGYPGGAGFAEAGFDRFPEWIEATFSAVRSCECDSGCPSCVQSPKCGNGNNPLDKQGAIALLGALVTMTQPPPQS